ncbi:type II toxin-antitoxin system RelE/ParE family toxin [Stenotrophomonas cyclobalanopsidis]|uniref:type II toxin-antitoxin system RelE/ParE family toxin n=1 Tax=Stenotrophomonas cyclobalanopsidis TaxID=2771362 RepID=UPI003460FC5F
MATQVGHYWFFLFCYEKNVRASISSVERDALPLYASEFLRMSPAKSDRAVICGELQEICHDKDG